MDAVCAPEGMPGKLRQRIRILHTARSRTVMTLHPDVIGRGDQFAEPAVDVVD